MFTGIIESLGIVKDIEKEKLNLTFTIESDLSEEIKIDQSISHDGVCLTVVEIGDGFYKVVAIKETIDKTNLYSIQNGDFFNLERCMKLNDRLDGHIVQGHVDTVAVCTQIEEEGGSYKIRFRYNHPDFITVEKGSICVNGVSLTVVDSDDQEFSVAIIPYTWENTNFKNLKVGKKVNLEFDIIGKYIQALTKKAIQNV